MKIDATFSAMLTKPEKIGGWTYVIWPDSKAFFNNGGSVKIRGTIDGHPFRATFMPLGNGQQMLPIKRETRELIGKKEGDMVTINLLERI